MPFARYVALGDSTTEGLDDPGSEADAFVGFADRLALRIAREAPELQYANLAIRGRKTRAIREEQLGPALTMRPDLVTVICGANDVLRRRVDIDGVLADLDAMVAELRAAGATVAQMTYPDLGRIMPAARLVSARLAALNDGIRLICDRRGSLLADLGRYGVVDRRLWSADLLHANTAGHARIAAAMAAALGLTPDEDPWAPLAPAPPPSRLGRPLAAARTARWAAGDLGPWLMRRVRGRSSGDGRAPKRPTLTPVVGAAPYAVAASSR